MKTQSHSDSDDTKMMFLVVGLCLLFLIGIFTIGWLMGGPLLGVGLLLLLK